MYISCHFFTTWTIYLILYSSKFLSNLIICDVKMSNKKDDSILLVSFTSVFEKNCFWKIIWCTIHFGKTRSRINNKFLNKAVPKQYVTSKEHFLSKSVQKKNQEKKLCSFFLCFCFGGKSLHNTTEFKEFASTDTRVSTATYNVYSNKNMKYGS